MWNIIGYKVNEGKRMFLQRWMKLLSVFAEKAVPSSEETWEPIQNLSLRSVIQYCEKSHLSNGNSINDVFELKFEDYVVSRDSSNVQPDPINGSKDENWNGDDDLNMDEKTSD